MGLFGKTPKPPAPTPAPAASDPAMQDAAAAQRARLRATDAGAVAGTMLTAADGVPGVTDQGLQVARTSLLGRAAGL